MLKILYYNRDTVIRNIAESLVISGFPMSTKEYTNEGLCTEINDLYTTLVKMDEKLINNMPIPTSIEDVVAKYLKRGKVLGKAKQGSGHDCYLKGVTFNVIINAPSYWYPQFQRYHFTDIISSQSKMHKLTTMDLVNQCTVDVDTGILEILNDLIHRFNSETEDEVKKSLFKKIVANTPMGLTLTCGITINYLQIKGMLAQRQYHKLDEWNEDFVNFTKTLPFFNMLTSK